MAQFVVYGHAAALRPRIRALSDALHEAATTALRLPAEKRFHRFIPLDADCFVTPADRSLDYTIIEVSMFEGRSTETKKRLISEIYRTTSAIGLPPQDVEITISETPRSSWASAASPATSCSSATGWRVEPPARSRPRPAGPGRPGSGAPDRSPAAVLGHRHRVGHRGGQET